MIINGVEYNVGDNVTLTRETEGNLWNGDNISEDVITAPEGSYTITYMLQAYGHLGIRLEEMFIPEGVDSNQYYISFPRTSISADECRIDNFPIVPFGQEDGDGSNQFNIGDRVRAKIRIPANNTYTFIPRGSEGVIVQFRDNVYEVRFDRVIDELIMIGLEDQNEYLEFIEPTGSWPRNNFDQMVDDVMDDLDQPTRNQSEFKKNLWVVVSTPSGDKLGRISSLNDTQVPGKPVRIIWPDYSEDSFTLGDIRKQTPKFKAGDKVRIISPGWRNRGHDKGVIDHWVNAEHYVVNDNVGMNMAFREEDLELIQPPKTVMTSDDLEELPDDPTDQDVRFKKLDLDECLRKGKNPEMIINLNHEILTEGTLAMMGAWIEYILNAMFGRANVDQNMKVRGTPDQVRSFANALSKEKNYMEAMKKYGITDPGVMNDRYKLEKAVQGFEKETGLKWPFK